MRPSAVLARIALVVSLFVLPTTSCKTTGTGEGVVTDLGGKAIDCATSYVVGKAPDAYGKVSNILTSSDGFTGKKNALLELAKNIASTGGLEIVSCLVRQYIADVTDSTRMGASNPATTQGAADGRTFLNEVNASFANPSPSSEGSSQPTAPPPN
jgi:hypothetical protein